MRSIALALVASSLIGCAIEDADPTAPGLEASEPGGLRTTEPETPGTAAAVATPNMTYHRGLVLTSAVTVMPIFWGKSWANAAYIGDKISGLVQFYGAYGNSPYARTNTEYTDKTGAHVTTQLVFTSYVMDTTKAASGHPSHSTMLNEVCKRIGTPVANAYYPVYTDTPRGTDTYCAWHYFGTCHGVQIEWGFFYSGDGDATCDPNDTTSGRSHGLATLANASGHELSEVLTDPATNGWYAPNGTDLDENADKCHYTFSQPVQLNDGSTWKIQGNWSNAAYLASSGWQNQLGQKACLYNN